MYINKKIALIKVHLILIIYECGRMFSFEENKHFLVIRTYGIYFQNSI